MIIAAMFMVPVALLTGHGLPRTATLWVWCSGIGIVGLLLPFLLVVWAQGYVPSSVAASYFATVPLLILLFSRVFLGTSISPRKWIGLLIGSGGLVVLSGPGTTALEASQSLIWPRIALLLCCFILAGTAIVMRQMPKAPPIQTTAGALLAAGITSLPIAFFEIPRELPPTTSLLGLLGVGIISTGLGGLIRYWLIRRKGPVFITPNGYLAAMVAVVIGVVVLGEALSLATILGLVIIIAGLLISTDGSGQMSRN